LSKATILSDHVFDQRIYRANNCVEEKNRPIMSFGTSARENWNWRLQKIEKISLRTCY